MNASNDQDRPIRIGISSCLLGEKVRFDGGHKHDRFITSTLGGYFEWVPVCPEVEVGMGTPRDTIRLEQHDDSIRLIQPKTGHDLTSSMRKFSAARVRALTSEELAGYVLKKDSPSCGMERVKLYKPSGPPRRIGRGLFAEALLERFPNLPVEEEGRLSDPRLRENWVGRVFAYHKLRCLWNRRWKAKDLVEFHTNHKFTLLAHSPGAYRELGRLVANPQSVSRAELRERYESSFMAGMSKTATSKRHVNVLQHILGFFKKDLDSQSRHELLTHIEDYRQNTVPLVVPLTLIRHYVRLLDIDYLSNQSYLNPHPKELALLNHV